MSSEPLAGIKFEVAKLLLEEDESSFSAPLATLEKADKYSERALVGDAKGLSGRLCSKLSSSIGATNIMNTLDQIRIKANIICTYLKAKRFLPFKQITIFTVGAVLSATVLFIAGHFFANGTICCLVLR